MKLVVLNRPSLRMRRNDTGYLGLYVFNSCTCNGCNMEPGVMVRMREIWGATQRDLCPDRWFYCATAQSVVSAQRIRRMPLKWYRRLLQFLVAPHGHRIHQDHKNISRTSGWSSSVGTRR